MPSDLHQPVTDSVIEALIGLDCLRGAITAAAFDGALLGVADRAKPTACAM